MKSVWIMLICGGLFAGATSCGKGHAPQRERRERAEAAPDNELVVDTTRLTEARLADPENSTLAIELADTLAQRGLYSEAIAQYQEALRLDDQHAAGWHNLALCYERQGLFREAREAALMASTLQPEDRFLEREAVRIDVRVRHGESGERAFNEKISLTYVALATNTPEGLTRATAFVEDLTRNWPQQAETWNVAGIVAMRNGESAPAKAHFDRAIELNPRALQARYNRALLAWHERDHETAAWQLQRLKNLLKDDPRSLEYLDRLLEDLTSGRTPQQSRIEARDFAL